MLGFTWYFGSMRRYLALFLSLFDDIHVARLDAGGSVEQLVKVPIRYAPKEKMLSRVTEDPGSDRKVAMISPIMSYEIIGMNYASNRAVQATQTLSRQIEDNKNKFLNQFSAAPYDIHINLYVYAKNEEDAAMIVEQIIPFFRRDWTATIEVVPDMGLSVDVPIILENIGVEDIYEGSFETRKTLVWTLNFTIRGYFFGPVREKPIIKLANTTFYVVGPGYSSLNDATAVMRQTVQPGLDANGDPTTDPAITVAYSNIAVDDDWGYVVQSNTNI